MSNSYIRIPAYTNTVGAAMLALPRQRALAQTAAAVAAKNSIKVNRIINNSDMMRSVLEPFKLDASSLGVGAKIANDLSRLTTGWTVSVSQLPLFLPKFELPQLTVPMPKIEWHSTLAELIRGFDWEALQRRVRTPRNWPTEYEPYLPQLLTMLNDEGIPLAWVPNYDTLMELIDAGSAERRSQLLVERRLDILEDCAAELEDIESELLLPSMPYVADLIASCRDGHWPTAALAAVPLIHSVVEALEWPTDQQRVRKHHAMRKAVTLQDLMEQAARAPLVIFYQDWNPKSGRPRPTHLARHVMSHKFGPEQVSDRNCVVAVMLLTSLFVTIDQLGLAAQEIAA